MRFNRHGTRGQVRSIGASRLAVAAAAAVLGLGSVSVGSGMALLSAADAPPTAGAPAVKTPQPSKVAVLFLEKVQNDSERHKEIIAEIEKRYSEVKEKESTLIKLDRSLEELSKNIRQGVGDMSQMQKQWVALSVQRFQVEADAKDLRFRSQKEFAQKLLALKIDINVAIAAVAKRENLDIVIIRKDAEQAAVEADKNKNDLLGKKDPTEKTDADNKEKAEQELDREMTQKMMSKLENTFVWSNDSMDITMAVVSQLAENYKNRVVTPWDQIKVPEAGQNGEGGPDGGGGGGAPGPLPEE